MKPGKLNGLPHSTSTAHFASNLAKQNTGLSNLSSPSQGPRPVHGRVTRKVIAEGNERQAQEFHERHSLTEITAMFSQPSIASRSPKVRSGFAHCTTEVQQTSNTHHITRTAKLSGVRVQPGGHQVTHVQAHTQGATGVPVSLSSKSLGALRAVIKIETGKCAMVSGDVTTG